MNTPSCLPREPTSSATDLVRFVVLVGLLGGCSRGAPPQSAVPDPVSTLAAADPVEVLETYVRHPEAGLRGQAVRWRTWAGGGPVVDDAAWVQRAEVEALVLRDDDAAHERLLAIAADSRTDAWVRAMAALAHPEPSRTPRLGDYRTETSSWRRLPLALGAWAAGDSAARDVLIADLRTGMLDWNVDLMVAIGEQGDAVVASALAEAQLAAEPELQLAIAAARLLVGDNGASASFEPVITGDDVEARLEAVDLLVRVPTEAASQLLARAAARGPELVTWYVELAGIERGDTRIGRLRKAMASDNPEVRELAVRFAVPGAARSPWRAPAPVRAKRRDEVAPVVREGLVDVDPRVRRAALVSAARLGLDVAPVARALTGDAHPQVRIAAAGYLGLQ